MSLTFHILRNLPYDFFGLFCHCLGHHHVLKDLTLGPTHTPKDDFTKHQRPFIRCRGQFAELPDTQLRWLDHVASPELGIWSCTRQHDLWSLVHTLRVLALRHKEVIHHLYQDHHLYKHFWNPFKPSTSYGLNNSTPNTIHHQTSWP